MFISRKVFMKVISTVRMDAHAEGFKNGALFAARLECETHKTESYCVMRVDRVNLELRKTPISADLSLSDALDICANTNLISSRANTWYQVEVF